jgi:uncharacterized membrane protein
MTANRKITVIYIATLIGILLWIAALFYAPYLKKLSSPLSGFLYAVFSPTCHQIPSRCFYAFGHPMAVCARCLGVYSGFLLGMVIFPFTKGFSKISMPKVNTLIIMSIPIFIDVTGNFLGLWASSDWVRLVTGIVWAIILPFYFLAGITDYFLHKSKPTKLT